MPFEFTEYDGMILIESRTAVEKNLRRLAETGQVWPRWQYERGANHIHADMSQPHRVRVREEREIAAEFEAELRRAYPDRAFVISHLPGHSVSFYQLTPGAPVEDTPSLEPPRETVWCQTCQRGRPYHRIPETDAEFPEIEWGQCKVCGEDVIVNAGELLRCVTPGAPLPG